MKTRIVTAITAILILASCTHKLSVADNGKVPEKFITWKHKK